MKAGRLVGTAGIIADVTRQHETEERLRMAQKMEAIGRLAGGVAHDFNNLLTLVSSYTELAMGALAPDDPVLMDLREVANAAGRATSLTKQLLAFSRKQVMKPQVLDLNALIVGLRRLLERLLREDIALDLALDPALAAIRADTGQVEQVLMNLAANARDAMPGGGTLHLETSNVGLDAGQASRHEHLRPGVYVRLSVSDTGVGMDQATASRIFEPFFTTKAAGHGTGLGLATVYGIVNQSGGCITVQSEPGLGTTFQVFFPRDAGAPSAVRAAAPTPARDAGRETILVTEDDAAVRDVVRRVLVAAGYNVLMAASGAEAIKVYAEHGRGIDLLVTDVVMPGMNGRELADRLHALRPGLKVLYTSGYADDIIVHRGVLAPGTHFLPKPFTVDELLDKLRVVLDARGPSPVPLEGPAAGES